ncbi:MAG: hypothetical protein HC815_39815 [Richelia sp. RM1_1_1]|uniref:hypothetical protein n=1 Tax=Rivularia sp. UHCC 0363 TaxID=3110244 RepID=UPI0016A96075|nr:hypothetical protein [Rivularia sp. UHCC 0363]MEA5595748.1 hypothetical protein [Rivularia sp. UHCC 0363]NJN13709.1 hypothetical protein [Richelia sp. RM1_1_1]
MDTSALLTVASIISGFGITIFTFRLQREIQVMERNSQVWIPWADYLVITAVMVSLLIGILPIVVVSSPPKFIYQIANGACAASIVMLAGYVPGILAHYRFILAKNTRSARQNPEPSERWIVIMFLCFAFIAFTVASTRIL